ncbi:hypothetical protein GGR57DRAFT_497635 [Xylariaceae sp. FL1272]|nr:hypothetical protein GGR57DRAFT_497635 [Xylariaceae sp. FL1272]
MARLQTNSPKWLGNRDASDENTGYIYTTPFDTINGSFAFPRQYPLQFRESSQINITWDTKYEGVNLYYYQRGKVAVSTQIATNLATSWYQWEVFAEEKNLTEPYVFHMVNARGTAGEQYDGGFWSTSFFILRDDDDSTSSSTSSAPATSSTKPSSYSTDSASITSSNIKSNPTSTLSPSPEAAQTGTALTSGGLSTGGIAGVAIAGIIAAILLALVSFCYGRRKARGRQQALPEIGGEVTSYWKSNVPYQGMPREPQTTYSPPQEMSKDSPLMQEQKIVYELSPGSI